MGRVLIVQGQKPTQGMVNRAEKFVPSCLFNTVLYEDNKGFSQPEDSHLLQKSHWEKRTLIHSQDDFQHKTTCPSISVWLSSELVTWSKAQHPSKLGDTILKKENDPTVPQPLDLHDSEAGNFDHNVFYI